MNGNSQQKILSLWQRRLVLYKKQFHQIKSWCFVQQGWREGKTRAAILSRAREILPGCLRAMTRMRYNWFHIMSYYQRPSPLNMIESSAWKEKISQTTQPYSNIRNQIRIHVQLPQYPQPRNDILLTELNIENLIMKSTITDPLLRADLIQYAW